MKALTPLELRIAKLVAWGMNTREIAREIKRPWHSVRNSTEIILEKTGARRLAQAVYILTKGGMI